MILTARLSNDTDLRWEPNKEPDLAGYEIVWRDTTSAVWTNSKPVGNVTSFTMKGMSKDNYFFGVRAIDRDGNRSRGDLSAATGTAAARPDQYRSV